MQCKYGWECQAYFFMDLNLIDMGQLVLNRIFCRDNLVAGLLMSFNAVYSVVVLPLPGGTVTRTKPCSFLISFLKGIKMSSGIPSLSKLSRP